jgi:hypothetical protein
VNVKIGLLSIIDIYSGGGIKVIKRMGFLTANYEILFTVYVSVFIRPGNG